VGTPPHQFVAVCQSRFVASVSPVPPIQVIYGLTVTVAEPCVKPELRVHDALATETSVNVFETS